jgi:hypothetical protein
VGRIFTLSGKTPNVIWGIVRCSHCKFNKTQSTTWKEQALVSLEAVKSILNNEEIFLMCL